MVETGGDDFGEVALTVCVRGVVILVVDSDEDRRATLRTDGINL